MVEERHRRTQQSNERWSSVPSEQDILLRHIRGHFPRSRQRRDRPTISKNLIEDRTRGPVHHMSYLFRLAIITPLSQGSHSVAASVFLATRISVCHRNSSDLEPPLHTLPLSSAIVHLAIPRQESM